VEDAADGFEPDGTFEPPVAEEFGVKGGAEHGRDGPVGARLQRLPDEGDEVAGVFAGAVGGLVRVVDELVAHVDAGAGDLPVAMAAGKTLLVEVEVVGVGGVAGVAGPDLQAGAGIAGKDSGGEALVVGAVDEVGLVEIALGAVEGLALGRAGELAVGRVVGGGNALTLFDEVGIDEEEVEVGFGERLLNADAFEAWLGLVGAGGLDGVFPEAGGAVATLGRPDAAGMLAEVANVGGDGGADLGADALVGAEQRHVAVGGAAGEDLDHAGVVEVTEAADDVSTDGVEVVERGGEEAAPHARGLGEVHVSGLDEVGFVLAGGDYFAREIAGKFGEEEWVGELLHQDGREIDIEVGGNAVALQAGEHAQQGEIGFGRDLVQPLNAMGPGAVVDDVGQVGVEGQRQVASRSVLCLGQEQPQENAG
jgi:hypothetical protein